jgi:hypothetical protein
LQNQILNAPRYKLTTHNLDFENMAQPGFQSYMEGLCKQGADAVLKWHGRALYNGQQAMQNRIQQQDRRLAELQKERDSLQQQTFNLQCVKDLHEQQIHSLKEEVEEAKTSTAREKSLHIRTFAAVRAYQQYHVHHGLPILNSQFNWVQSNRPTQQYAQQPSVYQEPLMNHENTIPQPFLGPQQQHQQQQQEVPQQPLPALQGSPVNHNNALRQPPLAPQQQQQQQQGIIQQPLPAHYGSLMNCDNANARSCRAHQRQPGADHDAPLQQQPPDQAHPLPQVAGNKRKHDVIDVPDDGVQNEMAAAAAAAAADKSKTVSPAVDGPDSNSRRTSNASNGTLCDTAETNPATLGGRATPIDLEAPSPKKAKRTHPDWYLAAEKKYPALGVAMGTMLADEAAKKANQHQIEVLLAEGAVIGQKAKKQRTEKQEVKKKKDDAAKAKKEGKAEAKKRMAEARKRSQEMAKQMQKERAGAEKQQKKAEKKGKKAQEEEQEVEPTEEEVAAFEADLLGDDDAAFETYSFGDDDAEGEEDEEVAQEAKRGEKGSEGQQGEEEVVAEKFFENDPRWEEEEMSPAAE